MTPSTHRRFLSVLCALALCVSLSAQIAMTRTTFTAAYTPIATATGATASTASGDDAVQTAIPIGFTFNYLGTNYTDLGATTNGAAGFVGMTNTRFNIDLYTITAPNAILAPWWDDLTSPVGSMLYQTQGTPGSQTFTMQWSALSYFTTSTATINFQIILYEGTNIIEYRYGAQPTGTFNTASESACIGMKSQTGGNGQYLDAVTGSAFTGNATINAQTMWPTHNFRFTPGLPTPVAAGTYTVGNAGTYFSLSEAVADINHRGVAGPVALSLIDANYDVTVANSHNFFPIVIGPVAGTSAVNNVTIAPASGTSTITSAGFTQAVGFVVNQTSANIMSNGNEAILAVVGAKYIGISNVNLVAGSANIDRGLAVLNSSTTLGSQFCTFMNIGVTLNRTNTVSVAIEQRLPSTPTSAAGANSNNNYLNLTISNTYSGINVTGNATFPDLALNIGTTSATTFNSIGSASANDIGNGTTASYGITVANCSGFNIFNNEVRNVTVTGAVTADGIVITGTQGTGSCYMNKIHDIKSTSTTSTSNISGIRGNVTGTGAHSLRIYNNFVYGLSSGYTGAASATRQVRGIYVQTGGGGINTTNIDIDNNNVLIDGTATPNISSTCFETGSATGPVINVRNNVFFNNTGAQVAPAGHYTMASPSATAIGSAGSVSNRNDLYVSNTTQGFIGRGATTDYATLANWQAGMTQDANSLNTDPSFTSTTDLHVNAPTLNAAGATIAWVTVDIDNQTRSVTPDIGADEFVVSTLDAGASLLVTPVAAGCYTSTQSVVVRIKNYAVSALDFSATPVTVTCNITGAATATLNTTVNTNALNGNVPLASGGTIDVPVGTFNMSAAGTYTFNANTTLSGDMNAGNDAMPAGNISYQPGTIALTPTSVCAGNTVTMTLSGNTSTSFNWEMSTDGGVTWTPIVGATTSPYVHTPTDTTIYRSLMCGNLLSTQDTVMYFSTVAPTTMSDTVCGIDTAVLSASGPGTLIWYTTAVGGSPVNTGTTYSPSVAATTTYYVESSSGSGPATLGAPNNAIGTGLQSTAPQWLNFNVLQSCVLQSVVVYPGAAGNVVLEWQTSTGGLIQSATMAVTASQIGQPVVMTLNWNLVPGTAYRLARGTASVSLYRNDAGAVYPYTAAGYVSITGNSFSPTYYYWGYNWTILTGCVSARTPVTAYVISTAPVTLSATNSPLCSGDTATITASSTNLGYNYTWTPAASLSSATGASVMAFPSSTTSYIVTADSSGCVAMDTIAITVNPLPGGIATQTDTLICIGESDTLFAIDPFAAPFISTNVPVSIPDANPAGATSTITVPYAATINPSMSMNVCFDMTHTWDADMSLTLISPNGTQLDLTSANGGAGDNYNNTCFSMSAPTNITSGVAPFTGSYIPEGAGGFNVYNGENTQGTWSLFMVDGAGGDVGTLNAWRISFTTNNEIAWTSNPVGFTSTNDTIIVNPTVTTDYILTVTDTVTNCSVSYTKTVMVNPPLSLSVSNDSTICNGDSLSLMAMGSGGDGNISYSWSNGDTTATIMAGPTMLTSYVVTITDGCTTPAAMDTVMVDVAVPVSIASISNDTMVCSASTLMLWATTAGGAGIPSYMWSNGPTTAGDTLTTNGPATTTDYVVMVMDACGTTASDTVTVMTYGTPVAMVMNADTTVCNGDTIVAMSMGSGGDGNFMYSWNNGPVTMNDTVVATSSMTYVVTVTDGCGLMAWDSVSIGVFAPVMVTASNDTAVCYPNYAYFSSSVSGGNGNNTYSWSTGSTTAVDSSAFFGTSTVSVTVTDGCGSMSTDSILVTVNYSPIASFTENTVGSVTTFTNISMYATSYSWNFGDSQTSTLQSPSHTYATNGTYTVTLVVTNSCGSDTMTSVVMIDVGINDPAVMQTVNVYPNPATDYVTISFGMMSGDVTVELYDVQGKLLNAENLQSVTSGSTHEVNLDNYESGMYLLKITSVSGSVTYKVNVQK